MNYRKYIYCVLLLTAFSIQAHAQDATDALRYSYLSPMGTARSIGFGSALGSIGGDFTSLSVNPAGIGIYRTSEFTITPSIRFNSTQGSYMNNTETDNNVRFNFNNIGMVFTNAAKGQRYDRSDWKSYSFGIGMTRLADFNRDYSYSGQNSGANSSSYSELFALNATTTGDVSSGNTLGGRAYNAYLIDYDSASSQFLTRVPYKAGITQTHTVSERGGVNEVVFSFGGNYKEKLMLGATLGVPVINYTRNSTVTETALNPTANFTGYSYNEQLSTRGTGIDLKLGAIYKATDNVRLGVAIHTPTYYSLHDEYQYTLNNTGYTPVQSDPGTYDYSLVTPWRAILSATVIASKQGFITADYEFVNYSSAQFILGGNDKDYQRQINSDITNAYQPTSIFRIGGELKLTSFFMLRAGVGYYGSPYQSQFDNNNRIDISGGVGLHFDHMFVDFAYQHIQYTNPDQFYALYYTNATIIENAYIKNSLNTVAVTVGFKM